MNMFGRTAPFYHGVDCTVLYYIFIFFLKPVCRYIYKEPVRRAAREFDNNLMKKRRRRNKTLETSSIVRVNYIHSVNHVKL